MSYAEQCKTASSRQPLHGVRVLDFTNVMGGPYCTRLMADMGAEVIKIESMDGDHTRKRPPIRAGRSTYFAHLNCGKRCISIDLRKPEAMQIVRDLSVLCDVLVENFRPGVMRQLGLSYDDLCDINPRLIYCSLSGFGQEGPLARRGAFAPIVHALSGFDRANLLSQPGLSRPLNCGSFIADVLGGSLAFGAIQAALLSRERSGEGDCIDVSLLDVMLSLQVAEIQDAQFKPPTRRLLYQPVATADGFVIVAPVTQRAFKALANAIDRLDWLEDVRFSTVQAREKNWSLLMSDLEEWTKNRTAFDCERILNTYGIPSGRYLTTEQAMQIPHVRQRGTLAAVSDKIGSFLVTNSPFKFRFGRVGAQPYAADLGEDTRSTLVDLLGYEEEWVDQLIERRVLREPS